MLKPILPAWAAGNGPEADIVVSTRVRLARNLTDVPFPERASVEDLEHVAHRVRVASRILEKTCGTLKVLKVSELTDDDKFALVDAHVVSLDQVESGPVRLVVLDGTSELAIMVNEEDHLRLQAIVSGLDIDRAWQVVDQADSVLSRDLGFAFSPRHGYLTASLTNAGTGLRVSAMMHLAGLSLAGKLVSTLKAAYDLGVSVRGLFGEGTKGLGDFFQVSNEVTLGLPETEILSRVKVTADYLLAEERRERERLLKSDKKRLQQIAGKSIAAAKRCYQVTPQDALSILSPLRLAAAMGLVKGREIGFFNELLIQMGAGRPQEIKRDRFLKNGENTRRASVLKHGMINLEIKAN